MELISWAALRERQFDDRSLYLVDALIRAGGHVKGAADLAGVSTQTFSKAFLHHLGQRPKEWWDSKDAE